ncbi:unnamed protein product [Amoebophrya sp. A25]|nr:unnamed protein product [Amoebophrya sp. A25]|eukprot:GSA25T00008938001.1
MFSVMPVAPRDSPTPVTNRAPLPCSRGSGSSSPLGPSSASNTPTSSPSFGTKNPTTGTTQSSSAGPFFVTSPGTSSARPSSFATNPDANAVNGTSTAFRKKGATKETETTGKNEQEAEPPGDETSAPARSPASSTDAGNAGSSSKGSRSPLPEGLAGKQHYSSKQERSPHQLEKEEGHEVAKQVNVNNSTAGGGEPSTNIMTTKTENALAQLQLGANNGTSLSSSPPASSAVPSTRGRRVSTLASIGSSVVRSPPASLRAGQAGTTSTRGSDPNAMDADSVFNPNNLQGPGQLARELAREATAKTVEAATASNVAERLQQMRQRSEQLRGEDSTWMDERDVFHLDEEKLKAQQRQLKEQQEDAARGCCATGAASDVAGNQSGGTTMRDSRRCGTRRRTSDITSSRGNLHANPSAEAAGQQTTGGSKDCVTGPNCNDDGGSSCAEAACEDEAGDVPSTSTHEGAILPSDEEARLHLMEALPALRPGEFDNQEQEQQCDEVVAMISHFFDTPIALISVVGGQYQWWKSCIGQLGSDHTSREVSFCAHTLLPSTPEILYVPDATRDPRFKNSPLVLGEPFIRFYCGAPIVVRGTRVGALCVIDTVPREDVDEEKVKVMFLRNFADLVASILTHDENEKSVDVQTVSLHGLPAFHIEMQGPMPKEWSLLFSNGPGRNFLLKSRDALNAGAPVVTAPTTEATSVVSSAICDTPRLTELNTAAVENDSALPTLSDVLQVDAEAMSALFSSGPSRERSVFVYEAFAPRIQQRMTMYWHPARLQVGSNQDTLYDGSSFPYRDGTVSQNKDALRGFLVMRPEAVPVVETRD